MYVCVQIPEPPNINILVRLLLRVSTVTHNIDIAVLSVCNVPVSDENGLTYCHSFFHHTVAK